MCIILIHSIIHFGAATNDDQFIVMFFFINCSVNTVVKKALNSSFPESMKVSSDSLFCPISSSNDYKVTITENEENHKS